MTSFSDPRAFDNAGEPLSIEIDATDQFEQAHPLATTTGIYPTLAAPFSKDWPFLFRNTQTTKTTILR
jgi:hypothetical protein